MSTSYPVVLHSELNLEAMPYLGKQYVKQRNQGTIKGNFVEYTAAWAKERGVKVGLVKVEIAEDIENYMMVPVFVFDAIEEKMQFILTHEKQ